MHEKSLQPVKMEGLFFHEISEQQGSYAYRPCITLTDNNKPKPAAGYAHTDLVWVCHKPKVLHAPTAVASQLLGIKVRSRHGADSGQDDYVGLTACREWMGRQV